MSKRSDTDKPLVSIIVCCYNRANLLPATMTSIFNQYYKPVEIIVLDDGSTDNTPQLMASYGDKIRYYRQNNQGIAATRSNACQLAQGELIAFVDDDDLMPADRINVLYDALCKFPAAIFAAGDFATIDDGGNLTGHRWLPESDDNKEIILFNDGYQAVLWPKVPAAVHTTLFKKADGEKIGWFDTQYRYTSEDKDFLARLGKLGPVVYVPEIVSFYRRGHESLTKNRMRAACGKSVLLQNHLKSLMPESKSLHRRLQIRILKAIKETAFYKSRGSDYPDGFSEDHISKCLSLLKFRDRFEYWKYTALKLPIKRIIRGKN